PPARSLPAADVAVDGLALRFPARARRVAPRDGLAYAAHPRGRPALRRRHREGHHVTLEPIDLVHMGLERIIAVYVVETAGGLAPPHSGPASTMETLEAGLAERGLALQDIRHLLLSHIHFDHAGAAGALVRKHPDLQVHVSPIGLPHVVDPTRLERSARRLWGDSFDTVWGRVEPVPEENVHAVEDSAAGSDLFPTPHPPSPHVS